MFLKTRRINHFKAMTKQFRTSFPPVTCNARRIINDGQTLSGQTVEKRRFPDIRAANNGEGKHGYLFSVKCLVKRQQCTFFVQDVKRFIGNHRRNRHGRTDIMAF